MTDTDLLNRSHADAGAARRAAFRSSVAFAAAFLAVSAAMAAFLAIATALGDGIDIAIWIRCTLVLGSAILLLLSAMGARRGSRSAWTRLRIISPIVLVAVIVIVSIPGFLPGWVRIEQAVCGLLVLPVAITSNLRRTSAHFPNHA